MSLGASTRPRGLDAYNQVVDRIGVVDTMFARYDMGAEVVDELKQCPGFGERFEVLRRTVPGVKDLGVECKRLIDNDGCCIVVALGMPGRAAIDQVCAHEASQGIMLAQLLTNTHVLEVFVHENEEDDPQRLATVCIDRARKHARNAYRMLYEPERLTQHAGRGVRQGYEDAGPLLPEDQPRP
jgi:riboflavin synthase